MQYMNHLYTDVPWSRWTRDQRPHSFRPSLHNHPACTNRGVQTLMKNQQATQDMITYVEDPPKATWPHRIHPNPVCTLCPTYKCRPR